MKPPRGADQQLALIAWGVVVATLAGLVVALGIAPWAGWALALAVALSCAVWFTRRALDAAALARAQQQHAPDPVRRPDQPAPERLNLG